MAKKISDVIFRLEYETEIKDGEVFVDVYAREPKKLTTCKDCKYKYVDDKCPLRTWFTHVDDDYCSYGEKKEE